MCLFQIWFPWCVCPEVGFLGHMAVLFPVFQGIPTLFSIVAVLVCIPTNSVRGFPLHASQNDCTLDSWVNIFHTLIYCSNPLFVDIIEVSQFYWCLREKGLSGNYKLKYRKLCCLYHMILQITSHGRWYWKKKFIVRLWQTPQLMHQYHSLSSYFGNRGDPTGLAIGGEKFWAWIWFGCNPKWMMITSQQCLSMALKR